MAKKIKHIILDDEPNLDYTLIGLSGTLLDFQLCAQLDRLLNWHFSLALTLEKPEQETVVKFELYGAYTNNKYTEIIVFANRKDGVFMISELKQFDLLVKINGEWDAVKEQQLINALRSINRVHSVFKIDLQKLKKPEWLEFELPNKDYLERKNYVERIKQFAAKDL